MTSLKSQLDQLFPAPTFGCWSTHCRFYREQQLHSAPHKAGPVYSYRNQLQFVCTLFSDLQWVLSEWVSDCYLAPNENIFSYIYIYMYNVENKWQCHEMTTMSALYKTNTLSWILIVPAHWNNSPQVDTRLHSNTLSWFRVNQFKLVLTP